MPDITDRESLEAWLADKPREVAVAIAARAALRAVPLLATALDGTADFGRGEIVLPIFFATSLAYPNDHPVPGFALVYAERAVAQTYSSVSAHSDPPEAGASGEAAVARAVHSVALAAAAALEAAAGAHEVAARAVDAAASAAHAAVLVDAGASMWEATSRDADMLGTGLDQGHARALVELSSRPLWHGVMPGGAAEYWSRVKSDLLTADEGWDVWTDWYEHRLAGRGGRAALERAVLTLREEDWLQGPAHVHAILKRLIEEHAPERSETDPNTPDEIDEALNGPFLTLSIMDFAFIDTRFTAVPFETDVLGDQSASVRHRDMVETLSWAAGELARLAERNKLGAEDARRCAMYIRLLDASPLNARLLQMIARALLAEIHVAHVEDRLAPGDAQVAQDFRTAHFELLEAFYPNVLTAEGRADEIEIAGNPSVEDVAKPLHALGGVLREAGDLVTDELRDAFDELDRVGQNAEREVQRSAGVANDERSRSFRRFANRAVATVNRFVLYVKRHAIVIAKAGGWAMGVGGGMASIEAQWGTVTWLFLRLQPIWGALRPFVPFL